MLGMTAGPLLTAATINCACVLIAAWVFFRRLGLTAMLWAGVLLLAVMWSGGTAVLTDTLSSNMTMYSVLCTAVLAWALIDGDIRLLPLAALVASYAAQQHLAAGLMVLALVVVAMGALVVQIATRVRRRESGVKKPAFVSTLAAVAIAAVCWAPVVIDQLTGHPGNLTKIVRFARDNTRQTLGLKSGIYQGTHAVTPPTILGRTDTTGAFFLNGPGTLRLLLALLVVGALITLAWGARRRAPGIARLALVALVLLAAGTINGSNVPQSIESTRVNLYRWTWAFALVTWAALGMGIVYLAGRACSQHAIDRRAARLGPPALLVVAALLATTIVFVHGTDDHNRDLPEYALEKRIDAEVLAKIDRHHPLLVIGDGTDATLSVAPHLILRLIDAGVRVQVLPYLTPSYGNGRAYRPDESPQAIVVASGWVQQPSGPGRLLAVRAFGPKRTAQYNALSAARTALLDDLSNAAFGTKVQLAPGADQLIKREYPGLAGYVIGVLFANLAIDPRAAFGDPAVLHLVLRGIVQSPVIDPAKVRRLLSLPPYPYTGTYGDEQVAVHLLSPADALVCSRRPCFAPE
jgi:hypothetical protein